MRMQTRLLPRWEHARRPTAILGADRQARTVGYGKNIWGLADPTLPLRSLPDAPAYITTESAPVGRSH